VVEVLEGILGNATAEKVLLYLEQYEEGYAQAIADTFQRVALSQVQRQLERLEAAGLLVSQLKGRTRLFTWNPRYAFLGETRALLRKALRSLPDEERRRYFSARRRPRRTGKPL
jgi:DNA-binding transcriptional ArsR family regulator